MKAVLVQTNTPTEKGSYSFVGGGLAVCSPCCGNTFYSEPVVADRSPLTVGPLFCPACGKDFVVTHGEIAFSDGMAEPLRAEAKKAANVKVEKIKDPE
jgi:hypothetical protein